MSGRLKASNGQYLDELLMPIGLLTTPRAPTGWKQDGVDIAELYEPSTGGDTIGFATGFKTRDAGVKVDVGTLFRSATYVPPAPVITGMTSNSPRYVGEVVHLTVGWTGVGSPQWYAPGSVLLSGEIYTDLFFTPTSSSQSGTYTAVVTGPGGSDSDSVSVTINEEVDPPEITALGSDSPRNVGETVHLSCTATGADTYQWLDPYYSFISGATGSTYSFTATSIEESGLYYCRVTNDGGSDEDSTYVTIDTAPPSVIVSSNSPRDVGQVVNLTATASGSGPLSYQWYYNSYLISGATASTHSFTATTIDESGTYSCTVTSPYGTDSDSTYVYIY